MQTAAPLSAPQVAARLRAVDGIGSGIEPDLVLALRPARSGAIGTQLSTLHAGLAAGPPDPAPIRLRATLGL